MKFICGNCIQDAYLRSILQGKDRTCSYCRAVGPCHDLEKLGDACLDVLASFYEETHNTMAVVHFNRSPEGKDLQDTLQHLKVVADAALGDLVAETLRQWQDAQRDSPDEWEEEDDPWFKFNAVRVYRADHLWRQMERSLHREARFLNRKALDILDRMFADLHTSATSDGGPVIVMAGPGHPISRLIRARVFQTDEALDDALAHPARNLGTPPVGASQAGRMNAKGQAAFYGATSERVAIAEVRPPVGSWVVTAPFVLAREMRLLDLSALAEVRMDPTQSLFDPESILRAERRDFLRALARRMVRPVMPDHQDRDYIVTQVVADYLAGLGPEAIDGIVYSSVQVRRTEAEQGVNVVLFHHASGVYGAGQPYRADVHLWEYEDEGPGMWLDPRIRLKDLAPLEALRWSVGQAEGEAGESGFKPSLRLDVHGLDVHEVRQVHIETYPSRVDVAGTAEWAADGD